MEDAWVIHLFDDVAVKFEINGKEDAEYGKIMRMRKRGARNRWIEYVKPVDLSDRAASKDVFVMCYYYRPVANSNTKFTYDTSWNTPVSIDALICPANLTYDQASDTYQVDVTTSSVVEKSLAGAQFLEDLDE